MPRLVVATLALGLAAGLAIGLTRDSRGPVLPRLEAAITKDARQRYHTRILRTECARFQQDRTMFSCTAVQYQSPVAYTGKVYVAKVYADGRFKYRPYLIPIWLGI